MDRDRLLELLKAVAGGGLSPGEALGTLADFPFAELSSGEGAFACLDTHRVLRRGVPETVYGAGKTPDQLAAIVDRLAAHGPVLATRVSPEGARGVLGRHPAAVYDPLSRVLVLGKMPSRPGRPVLVLAAGTSDLSVAEEAARTAEFLGRRVERGYDVGVAGLHRLLARGELLRQAGVIVAVAGMEGALPGVVAGMSSAPVIGVPTSVGYGVSLGGLTPLFSMLASCAGGLTVVNIDNGYGAALAAHLILDKGAR